MEASQGSSNRASRMQSRGLVKCEREKEGTDGTDSTQGRYSLPADADLRPPFRATRVSSPRFVELVKKAELGHAKTALEFYEKSRQGDTEFEIIQVVAVGSSRLKLPEDKLDTCWMHVTFLAKPKIGDVSPTHFFAELFKDDSSGKFKATYCSTYEPAPGFDHGCVFCMPMDPHPIDGYLVGRPPWYRPKVRWG